MTANYVSSQMTVVKRITAMDSITARLCTATMPYCCRCLAPKLSTSGASPAGEHGGRSSQLPSDLALIHREGLRHEVVCLCVANVALQCMMDCAGSRLFASPGDMGSAVVGGAAICCVACCG